MSISSWFRAQKSTIRMSRATFCVVLTSLVFLGACDGSPKGPRALILVDATDARKPAQAAFVADRKALFEKSNGRTVRVLRVTDAEAAIDLASRGEADVAVVPEAAPQAALDRFFASEHGRQIGVAYAGSDGLKILAVNVKQHPKVDTEGEALARFLVGNAESH